MPLSARAQATLLLTLPLARTGEQAAKPLSLREWNTLSRALSARGRAPEDLLDADPGEVLGDEPGGRPLGELRRLLERGVAFALAVDRWESAGLWAVTRGDSHYPARLKQRLREKAPAFLFGAGSLVVVEERGIAVVGSRNASDSDLGFAVATGQETARSGLTLFSGGARGVDESAMNGTLDAGGNAVGVLADSLLRAATARKHREGLMAGRLTMLIALNPETGFTAGNAMARNRLIYCLADAAVVVTMTEGRGGTWTGAVENQRSQWVPLWIRSDQAAVGPHHLTDVGARSFSGTPAELLTDIRNAWRIEPALPLAVHEEAVRPVSPDPLDQLLEQLQPLLARGPVTVDQVTAKLGMAKATARRQLSAAVKAKRLRKRLKPPRYEAYGPEPQLGFF